MENLRGLFNNILPQESNDSEKIMSVTLLKSKCVSFDLIFNDDFYNKQIKQRVKEIEREYTNYSDRKMIYYICIRNKTEIKCITRSNELIISIYKNENSIAKKIKIKLESIVKSFGLSDDVEIASFDQDKIFLVGKTNNILYLCDIIDTLNIETYFYSKIVYVGLTDFPLDRPFDKPHKGIMRAIYNYKNKGNDIFIYYNLFHIRYTFSENENINFIISNSLVEILDKNKEASLVEKSLIKYFLPENYSNNYKREISELKNILQCLKREHNIKQIYFKLAFDKEYHFYKFYSDLRKARNEHSFIVDSENANIAESSNTKNCLTDHIRTLLKWLRLD
ncbi:MAG: hypothetical protein LBG67_03345 [Campylobacteraceae bacterium]|jgi:hypothetical protein|nr:hypothetical protein [Campylobacteraceae bacterium]